MFSSILHGLFGFCFRKGEINSPLKKLKTENKELCCTKSENETQFIIIFDGLIR